MGLIYDNGTAVWKDRAFACVPVDGVGQQQIVVADLKREEASVAGIQEGPVPAGVPLAVADLGDANALPVICTEVDGLVGIQPFPQGEQGLCRRLVFLGSSVECVGSKN